MRKRTNRLIVAVVLIAAGIAGGFFMFTLHMQAEAALAASADVSARVERMIATARDIASAQQAYVAPGQPNQPWFERSATVLRRFADDLATLRPRLRSADGARVADDMGRALQALIVIDDKAREDLVDEQSLLAADLIFSEGREAVESLIATAHRLSTAEQSVAASQRASLEDQQWAVLGIVGAMWMVGLLMLVPRVALPGAHAAQPTDAGLSLSMLRPIAGDAADTPASIDLAAAADVCASLARVTDVASLPDALAKAAAVLDANGIIVWMAAGDELFPALAYGYDDRLLARVGAIPRHAENVTADAWRSATTRTVAADGVSRIALGALAVPLCGTSGCVGVFAAEVRHGRESDPSTRAVATMIAAQLASVVSAWPAGSATAHDIQAPASLVASAARPS
jgi:hypothetical protein